MMITFGQSSCVIQHVSWQFLDKDSKAKLFQVKTSNMSYNQFYFSTAILLHFCFNLLEYVKLM